MYNLAEKTKIIKLFNQGKNVTFVHLHSNVSKSTLYRWKKQFETLKEKNKKVEELILQGNLEEAKRLAKEILKIDQKNLYVRSYLITINKQQGKLEEVERLAKEIIALDPNNLPARYTLITIYKQQGKLEEVKRLAKEIIALDPNNSIARKQLRSIRRQLKRERKRGDFSLKQKQDLEEEMLQQDALQEQEVSGVVSPLMRIQIFRKQVQDGIITLENMSEHESELSGLPEVQQKLLLAEAYTKFNIPKKAIQLLKEARNSRRCNRTVKNKYYHKL